MPAPLSKDKKNRIAHLLAGNVDVATIASDERIFETVVYKIRTLIQMFGTYILDKIGKKGAKPKLTDDMRIGLKEWLLNFPEAY